MYLNWLDKVASQIKPSTLWLRLAFLVRKKGIVV